MSDLIVKVVRVDEILDHPNADKLEIIKIGGWQIVSGKGNYKVGDLVVHIPQDAMVPKEWADKWEVTKYLSWRKNGSAGRVRAAKLRGVTSFGFLSPNESGAELGTELSEHYGITKYEPPPLPVGMSAGQMASNHPLFHQYTDIQNLRNYPDKLDYSDNIVILEKLHGCVPYNTKVHMSDGSKKPMNKVIIGDYVLGMDNSGSVIPTKVTNIFNNGPAKEWLSIEGKRRNAGRGNHYFSLKCTPNHKIWCHAGGIHSQGLYRAASEIQIGDYISLIRSELSIPPLQEQVLIGKMLGDGSLTIQNSTAFISFGHKQDHEEYLHWTMRGLGNISGNQQKNQISGYGTTMCRSRTISSVLIKEMFEHWHVSGSKQIPKNIVDKVGPIALAFWYMDDGSLSRHEGQEDRALFATCAFNDESVNNLRKIFLKFGIVPVIYKSDNGQYNRLRLNSDDADRLFLLIAPYVPPIMQYKLPERYRGHSGWLPEMESQYKPILVEQQITSINRNITCESSRYDIETETHNFFANGVLVHNSNSRVGWVRSMANDGSTYLEKVVGTHRTQRKVDDCGAYGLPFEKHEKGLQDLLAWANTQETQIDSLIVFGEIYGAGVQDLHYGAKTEKDYRIFDIAINGHYLSWMALKEICHRFDLPIVPRLSYGNFNLEQLKEYAIGNTTLNDTHIREGIVVRPFACEKTWKKGEDDPYPKRMIFKLINEDYLTRKDGTEHH